MHPCLGGEIDKWCLVIDGPLLKKETALGTRRRYPSANEHGKELNAVHTNAVVWGEGARAREWRSGKEGRGGEGGHFTISTISCWRVEYSTTRWSGCEVLGRLATLKGVLSSPSLPSPGKQVIVHGLFHFGLDPLCFHAS